KKGHPGRSEGSAFRNSPFASLDFAQPPLQVAAFAVIRNQLERARVALRRFLACSAAPQQFGARSVEEMVVLEIASCRQRIHNGQSRVRACYHRNSHRAVQRSGWRRLDACEDIIAARGLLPGRTMLARTLAVRRG